MMDRKTEVTEIGDTVQTKTIVPDMGFYSPYYQGTFYVAKRYETPSFNTIRRMFGLDSAAKHTTIVKDRGWVGSVRSNSDDRKDDRGADVAIAALEQKGYEVISLDEARERYGTDVESSILATNIKEEEHREEMEEWYREDIENAREICVDQGFDIVECHGCCGFFAVSGLPDREYEGPVFRGKVLEQQEHMMECDARL